MSVRREMREVEVVSCDGCGKEWSPVWHVTQVGDVRIDECSDCYWTDERQAQLVRDLKARKP